MICAIIKIIVSIFFLICGFLSSASMPILINIWMLTLFSGVYDIYRLYKEKHIVISKDNIKDYKDKKLFRSYINIVLGLILLIFSCLAISGTPKSMFELTGSLAVLVILVYSSPVIVGLLCLTSGVYNVSKTKNLYLNFDDSENNDNNIDSKASDEKSIDTIEKEPIVSQASEEKDDSKYISLAQKYNLNRDIVCGPFELKKALCTFLEKDEYYIFKLSKENLSSEVAYLICATTVYALKERKAKTSEINRFLDMASTEIPLNNNVLKERVNLYISRIKHGVDRMDCFFGYKLDDPISILSAVFVDILQNSSCAINYENATEIAKNSSIIRKAILPTLFLFLPIVKKICMEAEDVKYTTKTNRHSPIVIKLSDELTIQKQEEEKHESNNQEKENTVTDTTADMKTNELQPTKKLKQKKSRNYNKLLIVLLIFTTVLTLINSAILITPHIANNISKQEYKVTFYYNENVYFSVDNDTGVEKRRGNSTDSSSFYKFVTTIDYIDTPKTPTNGSYKFYGWYTEPECINRFDFNNKINKDTKLYAKWVRYY